MVNPPVQLDTLRCGKKSALIIWLFPDFLNLFFETASFCVGSYQA